MADFEDLKSDFHREILTKKTQKTLKMTILKTEMSYSACRDKIWHSKRPK